MASPIDFQVLLAACFRGEDGAWESLVGRYRAFVGVVVRRLLTRYGVRHSHTDVEEIAQEVFVSLCAGDFRILRRYDPAYSFQTFLRHVARDRTVEYIRTWGPPHDSLDEFILRNLQSRDHGPSEHSERNELVEEIRRAAEELPHREALALQLHLIDELPYADIAQILGMQVNSIGPLLSRTAQKLRKALRLPS